ncbi:MAG: LPS-assembly protein LptD [Acidobacteriota bacterium]
MFIFLSGVGRVYSQQRARVELPYQNGTVVITADRINRESSQGYVAQGEVVVTYRDIVLKSDRLTYNSLTQMVIAEGGVEMTRGVEWLKGSRGEFDLKTNTGTLHDASGFTDQELFVRARTLVKTGPDTFVARSGFLTACDDAVPKWSFKIHKARIKVNSRAFFSHTVLRVKNVPVFYLPYMAFPTGKKERSSGFLLPTTGNSNNKGRRLSQPFYLVLGCSADLQVRADYYSKRGFGYGYTFRTRPNRVTSLELSGFTVDDRLDQGGTSFNATGETFFGNGFRLVADFNLVSNFVFRRVFSESFFTATRPTEASRVFLTNNFGNKSFNFRISRNETIFPGSNAVIRHLPVFNFKLRGQRLFATPFYVDVNASAEGVSRADSEIETPSITQRLDFHPEFYFSLPLFQGLRLTPRVGGRETFYSDRLVEVGGKRSVDGESLSREYFEFTLDVQGWGLSKIYRNSGGPRFKHLIEPEVRYRYLTGVDNFNQVIRFDGADAVANTNEVEYALVNRFFVKEKTPQGTLTREWLSVKVGQKYFFDTDFGGALREGSVNQFFPLNTLTGFPYGAIRRRFSPLTTVARLTPGRRYSFDVRGDYDFEFDTFRNFSITGFMRLSRFSLGTTYFVTQELEPGTFETNQLQGQISYGNLKRGFSTSAVFSYDARTTRLLNLRSRANYFWDCCGVSLEFQRINVGLRQEQQIRFSFFLKGIGSFGTIRRPESIF